MATYGSGLYGADAYGFPLSDTPAVWVQYSTSDADDPAPVWETVTDELVRAFNTSRGRDNERSDVDAGTAQITLDNRDRTFDPVINTAIRPMNRWWLQSVVAGTVESMFVGYAETYQQEWPDGSGTGGDAITIVSCADEMKVLALDKLPTTDPPRNTYTEVVAFDGPNGYWPMDTAGGTQGAVVGPIMLPGSGGGFLVSDTEGAIVGQNPGSYAYLTGGGHFNIPITEQFQAGAADEATEFTIEGWFAIDTLPASEENLWHGPVANADQSYYMNLATDGHLIFTVVNDAHTVHTVTSTTLLTSAAIPNQVWYHVVGTITGGNLRLYVNGVEEDSTAFSGQMATADPGTSVFFGNEGVSIGARVRMLDELAFYRVGLPADRVLAHYQAGRERGFVRGQDPGDRIESVLDSVGSVVPRSIRTGSRAMTGSFMVGQDPLSEIRRAEEADNVDAVFFVAKDGTLTFLDDGHRSVSPWDTVQATFDDDGTDLPYLNATIDYSESFLYNEINVTRDGGTTNTSSNSTSISRYFKRSLALSSLSITQDADQNTIADALLAKYKDPMTRIVSLSLDTSLPDVAEAVFALDIGSRIRVLRTPPGGGTRIDQTLFVQRIAISGSNASPVWQINLGVSPL